VPLTLLTQQPDQLPEELASVVRDPLAFADVTTVLRARGMADVTATTVQLHRVPAALLRARRGDHDWLATAVRALRAVLPAFPWNNPESWPLSAAIYLRNRGDYRRALPLAERTYRSSRLLYGEDDPTTLHRAHNFGGVLSDLGEHRRAYELDKEIFARRRRLLGEDHPDTLTSAENLGNGLGDLGEHQRARDAHRDVLARRRRVLGEDHPDTLRTARTLEALEETG
jgi:tetratricopeptide (TPR) repeat protein